MFKKTYMQFLFQKYKSLLSELEFFSPYSQLCYLFKIVNIVFLFFTFNSHHQQSVIFALPMN